MFRFDVWYFWWFCIGITLGSTLMFFLNRKTTKTLQFQLMKFIDIITDLIVKNITLNRVAKRLITINKEILNKR